VCEVSIRLVDDMPTPLIYFCSILPLPG